MSGFILVVYLFGGVAGSLIANVEVSTKAQCDKIGFEFIANYKTELLEQEIEDPFIFHECTELGQPV